ncbi:MAG: methylmalonyl Co-A mutase-associated GTPase MeaB [Anaerolineae bacterium]|jgi:LAO/AO transport system kinase|nr:methylmalonyl Co-A mutase-associated GTPase MeaB [Anaerolineae bacterium]
MIELVQAVLQGSRRALARLLTAVENGQADPALAALFPHTGRAQVIGITGAPGTGKSSLVNAITKAYRAQGLQVAIIAVDPTSPFTGGAILGDRIRMRDHAGDSGVFIRSMATRGSLGGLARATRDVIRVMDAAGFEVILVETVGAGQSEVDIARAAQTTLVIEAPGLGDDVQAIKAGILEIADVLVVNKADRPGATNTVRALKAMLDLGHPASRSATTRHHGRVMTVERHTLDHGDESVWIPPVIETIATSDSPEGSKGITELLETIQAHQAFLATGDTRRKQERQRLEIELYDRLQHEFMERLRRTIPRTMFEDLLQRIQAREIDPQAAVTLLLDAQLSASEGL